MLPNILAAIGFSKIITKGKTVCNGLLVWME